MTNFFMFAKDFLGVFFGGFSDIFIGIFSGTFQMFNVPDYIGVFQKYSGNFNFGHWLLAIIFVLVLIAMLGGLIFLIVVLVKKFLDRTKKAVVNQDLVDEIVELKKQVLKVGKEKDKILALRLTDVAKYESGELQDEQDAEDAKDVADTGESRFYKLTEIDQEFEGREALEYDNEITLEEICNRFRHFAAGKLKLYYEIKVIRLFIAGFSTTRLIVLQGISGTGKTSLPYAFGQFLRNPATIASVQPSWRDRTELFGYFNEFTKRFNETEVLKKMYEATYSESVYFTILDEMNIARVEYYFAEMLSILEMPSRKNWVVDLVPSGWDSDPKHIEKGRFVLPENMWFIGTANNDDSTFAISDKVYDRAIPININSKGVAFEAEEASELTLSYKHLEGMFKEAQDVHRVSQDVLDKVEERDNYVIEHFRLAFGNRIVKQLKEFIPAFVGCGGTELDGLDYVLANKILRKFESLNLGYIRDEIDGLIDYLSTQFGEENMMECKEYLSRLKKLF